jgi:hypothetical protein
VDRRRLWNIWTAENWRRVTMKTHTIFGKCILGSGNATYIRMGAEIAESHHERWDGSGYPYALFRDGILLTGSIISICDCYDALHSSCPYKQPICHKETMNTCRAGIASLAGLYERAGGLFVLCKWTFFISSIYSIASSRIANNARATLAVMGCTIRRV